MGNKTSKVSNKNLDTYLNSYPSTYPDKYLDTYRDTYQDSYHLNSDQLNKEFISSNFNYKVKIIDNKCSFSTYFIMDCYRSHIFENNNNLCKTPISFDFIVKYRNYIDWNSICKYTTFSHDFIRVFHEYVKWKLISERFNVDDIDFIDDFQDKLNWNIISTRCNLNYWFLYNYRFKFDWYVLTHRYTNNIDKYEFIDKYEDYIDWRVVSDKYTLTYDFIIKYHSKLDWDLIFDRLDPPLSVLNEINNNTDLILEKYKNLLSYI